MRRRQVAHRAHVIAMTDGAALRELILKEKPDLVRSSTPSSHTLLPFKKILSTPRINANIISKIKRALTTAAATTPDRAGDRGAGDGRAGANRGGGPRDGAAPLRGRSEHSNTNADRSRRRICAAATLRRFDRFSVAPEPSVKIRHQR